MRSKHFVVKRKITKLFSFDLVLINFAYNFEGFFFSEITFEFKSIAFDRDLKRLIFDNSVCD